MTRNEAFARAFCDAIREMAKNPDTIDNLESYLSNHFETWFKKYANTYEGLTYEMESFSKIS